MNERTIEIPAEMVEATVKPLRQLERFSGLSDGEIMEAVLSAGVNRITENQLKTKAKAHDMMIRKDGKGGYWLMDIYINGAVAPGPMTLEEVALWLDDLDKAQREGE